MDSKHAAEVDGALLDLSAYAATQTLLVKQNIMMKLQCHGKAFSQFSSS